MFNESRSGVSVLCKRPYKLAAVFSDVGMKIRTSTRFRLIGNVGRKARRKCYFLIYFIFFVIYHKLRRTQDRPNDVSRYTGNS